MLVARNRRETTPGISRASQATEGLVVSSLDAHESLRSCVPWRGDPPPWPPCSWPCSLGKAAPIVAPVEE